MPQVAQQPRVYSEAEFNELLKLLSMVIRQAGGEVRISAAMLQDTEQPKGLLKEWDNSSHELVLKMLSKQTVVYLAEEPSEWKPPNKVIQPVSPEPLLIPQPPPRQPPAPSPIQPVTHLVVDDERAYTLEKRRMEQEALKRIADFVQPDQARVEEWPSRQRSRVTPLTNSSTKPQPEELPPTYFRK